MNLECENFLEQLANPSCSPLYNILIERLRKANDLNIIGKILFDFWGLNRGKDIVFFEKMVLIFVKQCLKFNNVSALAWGYLLLGWINMEHDQFETGLHNFESSYDNFLRCKNEEGQARALNGKANIFSYIGIFDKSLDNYLTSLELAEINRINDLISAVSSNIGNLLCVLNQFDLGIEYFKKALEIESLPSINRAIQLTNLGNAYRQIANLNEAEDCLFEALEFCIEEKCKSIYTFCAFEVGVLKCSQGILDEARYYLLKAIEIAEEINIPRVKAASTYHMGMVEVANNNMEKAISYILEGLSLLRKIGMKQYIVRALLALSDIYGQKGDYQKAYKVSRERQTLEDEIFSEEIINRMSIFKVQQARRENLIFMDLYNRINIIGQIGQAITSTFDIQEIGKIIIDNVKNLMEADSILIGLYTDEGKDISFKIRFKKNKLLPEIRYPISDEDFMALLELKKSDSILINDSNKEKFLPLLKVISIGDGPQAQMKSFICSSLVINDKTLGLISIQNEIINAYSSYHMDILKALASYIAIALENEKLFTNVNRLANTDPLTGLLNRRNIFEKANKELIHHQKAKKLLSVVMIDIDKFKFINDKYGHAMGDIILKDFAKTCKNIMRNNDLLGRVGGDEFLLILPNTSQDFGSQIIERLRKKISEQEYLINGEVIEIRVSLGIAELLPTDESIDNLVKRADAALYEVKKIGGNCIKTAN